VVQGSSEVSARRQRCPTALRMRHAQRAMVDGVRGFACAPMQAAAVRSPVVVADSSRVQHNAQTRVHMCARAGLRRTDCADCNHACVLSQAALVAMSKACAAVGEVSACHARQQYLDHKNTTTLTSACAVADEHDPKAGITDRTLTTIVCHRVRLC
jgi:hypothetical protein